MPERKQIVINTGPLLALAVALERFSLLRDLYEAVHVPYGVAAEIAAEWRAGFAADLLVPESWLRTGTTSTPSIPPLLSNSLEAAQAALIPHAMIGNIETAEMKDCLEKSAPSDHLTSSAVNSGGMPSR